MGICCRPSCDNLTPVKGDKYYRQHCIPKWMQNNIKDSDSSMTRGNPLINYFTGKPVQGALVYGKWCVICEGKFKELDDIGFELFSRRIPKGCPGILKRTKIRGTPMRLKQFNRGRPMLVRTNDGQNYVSSYLKISKHRQLQNLVPTDFDRQMDAKEFVLSVFERLQYHPDKKRFPSFNTVLEHGMSFYWTNNFDISVTSYTTKYKLWGEIMYCMDEPVLSLANTIKENGVDISFPELGESLKIEWSFCGFRFTVFPKIIGHDHLWARHKGWFLGRTVHFKIALQEYGESPEAQEIMKNYYETRGLL